MNKTELMLCRVIVRRTEGGETLEQILRDYPLLSGDSLERVKHYVEHR